MYRPTLSMFERARIYKPTMTSNKKTRTAFYWECVHGVFCSVSVRFPLVLWSIFITLSFV